jgi:23S rRNA (cytosine1962-C5)-methyltransferase
MNRITLSKTRRLTSGHLWIFSNEIAHRLSGLEAGEIVEVHNAKGEFLAVAYVNPHTLIAGRILARARVPIDRAFVLERLRRALDYRRRLDPALSNGRMVFGEADLLPGLVVDKYADTLVLQVQTAGMERLTQVVIDCLEELLSPACVVLRNDSAFRDLEGLPREVKVVKGTDDPRPQIVEDGLRFEVDPVHGQKTGFFLDQRENRAAFAQLAGAGEGLDLFCYAGAWSVHLAARGMRMTCVDGSAAALEAAERNAALNGLSASVRGERADVFEFLKKAQAADSRYDAVVLDPPAFAKSRSSLRNAIKAYRQANTSAMSVLRSGGLLATCSCSYHLAQEEFLAVIHNAASALSRSARLIELRSQARDHPSLIAMPETRYLKCAFLEII